MRRLQQNEKANFSATLTASSQAAETALRQRRNEIDQAWDAIDQGWKELQQRMTDKGIAKPGDSSEGMVRLNAGGYPVNVRHGVLDGKQGASAPSGWALGDLFGASWDNRLPVDSDGRIVLDESPVAVKHLIHSVLTGSSAAGGAGELTADEKPYLPFVSRALGPNMSDPAAMAGIAVSGGSTILGPAVSGASKAAFQGWLPGEALELKYRATRDGWTGAAFHTTCDDSPRTVTLFQVGSGRSASVVGGYSSVSWSGNRGWAMSPGAYVFMLKDGADGERQHAFRPTKWDLKGGENDQYAVDTSSCAGPCFGGGNDMASELKGSPGVLTTSTKTSTRTYDIPTGSAFLTLNGQMVSEIEVFEVSPAAPRPTAASLALDESDTPTAVTSIQDEDDMRNFGVRIAGSLMEEQVALRDAEIELHRAGAKVLAAAKALQAVYGPDIAAGKEDSVVELSVRGIRMTTLRSTLQICPDSALATRFDEARWPANEKDVDEHGWRVVDCSPSVFSKVLDVLRMRKRATWAGDETHQSGAETVRVAVKAVDRGEFEEFVNMQFPGCESFVTECVDFLEESQATL